MTFTRTIAGRELEFQDIKPGQLTALRLFQKSSAKKSRAIARDEKIPAGDRLEQVQEIWDEFNIKALNFIEALLVDPAAVDFLIDAQIAGLVDNNDIVRIVIHGEDPVVEDDEDPAPVAPKKAVPNPLKKAAAAKKTANARRTKN
jgi:hypothetical protein